ncbi:MAG TPA: penicillin-insensitive murein endopeptidase [Xanthobacteraceae bacterium]|nr:penicillin-insensitive murein endopeptidase [Xanthobacteraceae bacterium]
MRQSRRHSARQPREIARGLQKCGPGGSTIIIFTCASPAPSGSVECTPQEPPLSEDGCGRELEDWLSSADQPSGPDSPPKAPLTVDDLPPLCRTVLNAQ